MRACDEFILGRVFDVVSDFDGYDFVIEDGGYGEDQLIGGAVLGPGDGDGLFRYQKVGPCCLDACG